MVTQQNFLASQLISNSVLNKHPNSSHSPNCLSVVNSLLVLVVVLVLLLLLLVVVYLQEIDLKEGLGVDGRTILE